MIEWFRQANGVVIFPLTLAQLIIGGLFLLLCYGMWRLTK